MRINFILVCILSFYQIFELSNAKSLKSEPSKLTKRTLTIHLRDHLIQAHLGIFKPSLAVSQVIRSKLLTFFFLTL